MSIAVLTLLPRVYHNFTPHSLLSMYAAQSIALDTSGPRALQPLSYDQQQINIQRET